MFCRFFVFHSPVRILYCIQAEWDNRLGVNEEDIVSALREYTVHQLRTTAAGARHMCMKEPTTMLFTRLLVRLFPASRFIFVIRDGRAHLFHHLESALRRSTSALTAQFCLHVMLRARLSAHIRELRLLSLE